jgi:GNAT superfamily N-acetyltransferase
MASLGKRFTHPTNRCYILKAIDTQTGDLVGWILFRWEEGNGIYTVSPDSNSEKLDFPQHYTREVRKKWFRITAEKKHVAIGALYVRIDWHGRGVGRKLVEHIYSKYDLDKELVIVQTRAMSEGFYKKLGFVTVDSTDIDLSEWGGKGKGYGLHRSPQMLRYPKPSGI